MDDAIASAHQESPYRTVELSEQLEQFLVVVAPPAAVRVWLAKSGCETVADVATWFPASQQVLDFLQSTVLAANQYHGRAGAQSALELFAFQQRRSTSHALTRRAVRTAMPRRPTKPKIVTIEGDLLEGTEAAKELVHMSVHGRQHSVYSPTSDHRAIYVLGSSIGKYCCSRAGTRQSS